MQVDRVGLMNAQAAGEKGYRGWEVKSGRRKNAEQGAVGCRPHTQIPPGAQVNRAAWSKPMGKGRGLHSILGLLCVWEERGRKGK